MENSRDSSRKVARLLDQTAARAFKMQSKEIDSAFDEAEAECLGLISSSEEAIEVKRRIAEWKLKINCDRDTSFDVVESLYSAAADLGFSILENEASVGIYYGQYCARNGRRDALREVLEPLAERLNLASSSDDSGFCREQRDIALELLQS